MPWMAIHRWDLDGCVASPAEPDKLKQGTTRQHNARQNKRRTDKTRQDKTRQG